MWLNLAAKLVPGIIKTGMSIANNQKKQNELEMLQKCVMQKRWLMVKLNIKKLSELTIKDWKDEFV